MYGMCKKIKNVEEMPAADDKLSNLIQQAFVFDHNSMVRPFVNLGLKNFYFEELPMTGWFQN